MALTIKICYPKNGDFNAQRIHVNFKKKKKGTTYELIFLRATSSLSCFLSSLNSRVSDSENITKRRIKNLLGVQNGQIQCPKNSTGL